MTLTIEKDRRIIIMPYVLPKLKYNLLEIGDVKKLHGPVILKAEGDYLIAESI